MQGKKGAAKEGRQRKKVAGKKSGRVRGGKMQYSTKKDLQSFLTEGLNKLAATYFPTWYSSIIGTNGLNFSVRYGKRWIPIVITTIILSRYKLKLHLNLRILY